MTDPKQTSEISVHGIVIGNANASPGRLSVQMLERKERDENDTPHSVYNYTYNCEQDSFNAGGIYRTPTATGRSIYEVASKIIKELQRQRAEAMEFHPEVHDSIEAGMEAVTAQRFS